MQAINAYFPAASFARNAIVGGLCLQLPGRQLLPVRRSPPSASSIWPQATTRSAAGTPYVRAGTDGKDVGADFTAMAAAMAAGSPAPSPAPAPALRHPPVGPAPVSQRLGSSALIAGVAAEQRRAAQNVTWTNLVNVTRERQLR